jgi:hypothetical protein
MRSFRIPLALIVLLVAAGRLFGQAGATGTILGTVTDSTGAILPNVKVTVTNTATNTAFRTTTSSAGDYYAPSLEPGTYSVSAEVKGFQKSVTTGFVLAVDQKVRIDLALKPGAVTETLEVTAQAVELDTDTAALSQLVSQQQVEELPLDGRNFVQLLFLGAGAVTIGGEQGTMRQGEGNAISINGGRPEGNNFTLDGLVNTDQAMETPAVILSQDAIQEVKVESGIYPAEYGFSASQVNVVSKGGTNQLHGTAFESDRNNAFDALPFPTATNFITSTPTANPVLKLNQFGFVANGPVWIPKLYDGRNRSFWMANYEGWRMNNGTLLTEEVPNPAVLQGNFSAESYAPINTTTLPGGPLPAYGTATCVALIAAGGNCMPVDPTTGQPFPNNTVPPSDFTSRIGLVAVANNYWGAPTVANQPEGISNFIKAIPGPLIQNQQTYRGDQNLGKLGSVFGRFTYSNYVNSANYNSGSAVLGLEQYFEQGKSWEVSHTINLGQKNVNNFRFGYLSANAPEGSAAPPASFVSALGEASVYTTFGPLQQTYPNVGLSGYNASGGGPVNSYSGSIIPEWEFADSFTSVHGRHTLGFGVDYRQWNITRNLDDDFYGDWSFSASTINTNNEPISATIPGSSCPNTPVSVGTAAPTALCGSGNGPADMMLGYYSGAGGFFPAPLSATTQAGNPQTHLYHYFAPYAEDDWKITPKLSMNIGLRWDYRAATSEAQNHFFWLDTQNPQGGLCYADPQLTTDGVAPGVGIDGVSPILRYCGSVPFPGPKNPFAPRLGFNYRLNDKTVVRFGYGIFYTSYEGREIDDSADIYPYGVRFNLNPSTQNGLDQYKLGNGLFPNFKTLGPFPESTLSFIAVIESEDPLNPYVQSWTLSIERELARNTTLEINYVGTHGTHLLNRHNIAQQLDIPAASLGFCSQQDANGNYINAVGANAVAPCSIASRLPYPNFNGTYIDGDFHGYSHYDAFDAKFEHRARDLAVTSVFTWAKSMDDKSATAGAGASQTGYEGFMDNSRPNLDYGRSDFNVPFRFVSSWVYQLPIGRGKKIAAGVNQAADELIGGWQLTGIATFQQGFPYEVTGPDIDSITGSGGMRANITPGCNLKDNTYSGNLAKFFRLNMNCFTGTAFGTYGNSGRNFLNQPGINDWDMGFGKAFALGEKAKFVFKADAFNTFNHHQYAGDVGGLLVAGSSGNQPVTANVGSANGGLITGASSSRIWQFGGKIQF